MRSYSSSNTYRYNSNIPQKPENIDQSGAKLELIKKNILKKINVERNLQQLKINEQIRKKTLEEKINDKLSRSDRKNSNGKQAKFEQHDKRIQEILTKKYKEIEEHENNALTSVSFYREETKGNSISYNTPQKKISKETTAYNIEEKLHEISTRLDKSADRAKKVLIAKATSGSILFNQIKKVKVVKQHLEETLEKKNLEKINKIKQHLIESSVKII